MGCEGFLPLFLFDLRWGAQVLKPPEVSGDREWWKSVLGGSQVQGRIGLHLGSVCSSQAKDFVSSKVNIKHIIELFVRLA